MKLKIGRYTMSIIDIKAIKAEAAKAINDEVVKKAKDQLISQMRAVDHARRILRAEELKLADLEARIGEGSV